MHRPVLRHWTQRIIYCLLLATERIKINIYDWQAWICLAIKWLWSRATHSPRIHRCELLSNKIVIHNTYSNLFLFFFCCSHYLNISSNVLGNIEHNAFQELEKLVILDLSSNNLKDLSLKLPESIEHISFARNKLKYWPMETQMTKVEMLELQENDLVEIFNTAAVGKNRIEFASLKFFNISRNHINSLPSVLNYPALKVFDASYNKFSSIPQYLGAQAPVLMELRLRGNPIKTIEFSTKISAHILDLSELLITEFDANVFNSIGLYFFYYV